MKNNATSFLVQILLVSIFTANSQTISLSTTVPTSSTTIGGGQSLFVGSSAGFSNTTGTQNTFLGFQAGRQNTEGSANILIGTFAGSGIKKSSYNVMVGFGAGGSNDSQYGGNVFIGHGSGGSNLTGHGNTFIGFTSGLNNLSGVGNVFLGNSAGADELGSSKLYISNSNTATPLIWGDFVTNQLKLNAKVGIGNLGQYPTNPLFANYKLFVTGGILTDEIRVKLGNAGTWADYVFEKKYSLPTLNEVENFIQKNGHLKNIPSAAEIKESGIDVAMMLKLQQEKIEELTLYIINQNKRLEILESKFSIK